MAADAEAVYKKALDYIYWYQGQMYDFNRNGEALLCSRLAAFGFEMVFDVGANIGDWSRMALDAFPRARVHAFELSEETFRTLTSAVRDERLVTNNLGLSNQNARIQYKDYGANSPMNTLISECDFHDRHLPPSVKFAQLVTGDAYCAQHGIDRIDFLKIDVEGADHLVLEGFSNALSRGAIRFVQFEYGYAHGDAHFLMKDFYRFFDRFGYAIGVIRPRGVVFSDFEYRFNDFGSGPNYVAVRRGDGELMQRIGAD